MKLSVFILAIIACAAVLEAAEIRRVKRGANRANNNNNNRARGGGGNGRGNGGRSRGARRMHGHHAHTTLSTLCSDLNLGNMTSLRVHDDKGTLSVFGNRRVRLIQTYGAIGDSMDVIGVSTEAEMTLDGQLTGHLYGEVAAQLTGDIPDPNHCPKDMDDMINIAIVAEGFDINDPAIAERSGKRVVYIDPGTSKAILAWLVEFLYEKPPVIKRPTYYIKACGKNRVIVHYDAVVNATLHQINRINKRQQEDECETDPPITNPPTNPPTTNPPTNPPTGNPPTGNPPQQCSNNAVGRGGNAKTGEYQYGVFPRCLNLEVTGNTCRMQNAYGKVVDLEQGTNTGRNNAVQFTCDEGYADAINGAYGIANDALYFGTITGSLYETKYDFKALSWVPKLGVHYDSEYDNAFWTGRDMYFGDGRNTFYPLVNQDVVAHELGHGITSTNSDLVYSGESGGINEAFSDMSGEAAENFGRSSNDWMVGYELMKSANRALRYLDDPTRDGRSIKHVDDYTSGMDVHYSSGIYNHAFYQMVQQNGMDIFDAYNCFLIANRVLWNANTNFADGACNVMQACYDIGQSTDIVKNSFNVVGIDLSNCDYAALAPTLDAGDVRSGIKASKKVKPIFELAMTSGTISADVAGVNVKINICADAACDVVLKSGVNSLTFNTGNAVFCRVSTNKKVVSTFDLKIV